MNESKVKYFLFNVVNFVYFVCGISLVIGSITTLADTDRVLISRLIPIHSPEPILYYICIFVLLLGLVVSLLSTLGCWATYTDNYFLITLYIFGIIVLLLGESVFGVVTVICPEYLGATLNREVLTDLWQRNYGVPGREQYTAAIDLFQTKLECCGISSGNDYITSWWKLRDLSAPNLTVPISCCFPDLKETKSFSDPIPLNLTLCQDASPKRFHYARFSDGCLMPLENWLGEQKRSLVLVAVTNLVVQLFILLAIILACIRNSNLTSSYAAAYEESNYKY